MARTIEELKAMTKEILTPGDVAPILNCDPQLIRIQAANDIHSLGFSASKLGSRIKIPRRAFIQWFEGENNGQIRQKNI